MNNYNKQIWLFYQSWLRCRRMYELILSFFFLSCLNWRLHTLIFLRSRNWSSDCITRSNSNSTYNLSLRFGSEDLDGIIGVLCVGAHRSSPFFNNLSSRLLPRFACLFICLAVRSRFRFVDWYDSAFTVLLRGRRGFLIWHDLRAQNKILKVESQKIKML